MKKPYKSDFFNDYKPSSHPRHGTDARTTYIRMLMRGYIKERSLIEQIKQNLMDHSASEQLKILDEEYYSIVDDMKLCFKRLLSRQEYDNKERYSKKDRELILIKNIQSLMQENKDLNNCINKMNLKNKQEVYKKN